MHHAEPVVLLLVLMAVLVIVAQKSAVPYPVLLVLGGLSLSFVPFLPVIRLDPNLVLFFFLPPLLYPAALFTSWRDFRRNLRSILFLAIGLVLMTTTVVAWVAHTFIAGLPWAAAFALGAIVSPPDAIAAEAILKRLGVPARIQTVLGGESLVNDATALVAYQFAVAAMMTGQFSLGASRSPFSSGWFWRRRPWLARRFDHAVGAGASRRSTGADHDLASHSVRRLPSGRAARGLRSARGGRGGHLPGLAFDRLLRAHPACKRRPFGRWSPSSSTVSSSS